MKTGKKSRIPERGEPLTQRKPTYNFPMQYRRALIPGGTYFFTVVTYARTSLLAAPRNIDLLREAFRYTLRTHPFTIKACVVLPDHIHMIWTLPENDANYSTRWRLIKSYFSRHFPSSGQPVWQQRYWEHSIRDEDDFNRHIHYIHYNPTRHGLCRSPIEWPYSSFRWYVREGFFSTDWGCGDRMIFEQSVGKE